MQPLVAQLGKYRLVRRIGVGGMAEVYEAELQGRGGFCKRLALKVLLPHCQQDPEIVKGFIDEASIAARLSHPNVVPVFDFGDIEGTFYLAMEYVDGWDLAEVLRRAHRLQRHLPLPAAAYLVAELAEALHYIHTREGAIVHRDVSPHNLFVTRQGHLLLGDFGVAKATARLARTASGQIKGKLAYLAPEQVSGDPISPRTDVYASGLVLFELITGSRYNPGANEVELLRHALHPTPRLPSGLTREAAALDDVVRGALQVHPAMRTRDAALLASQLGRFLETHPFGKTELAALLVELDRAAALAPISVPRWRDSPGGSSTGRRGGFEEEVPTQRDDDEINEAARPIEPQASSETVALGGRASMPAALSGHTWIIALVVASLLLASAGLLARRWRPSTRSSGAVAVQSQPASQPTLVSAPASQATRPATSMPARAEEEPPHKTGHVTHVRRRPRPRLPSTAKLSAASASLPSLATVPKPEATTAAPDRKAARKRLQDLLVAARQRGVWPGDDPELDRLRRQAADAIEREGGESELRRMADWVDRFRLDQGFIKRKLRRLEVEMAQSGRTDEQRRQLSLGAQEVLRLVLANHLVEASRRITTLLSQARTR